MMQTVDVLEWQILVGWAVMISVWYVLTFRWMQAFDDNGEHWWAVYVPVYRTVCALRTVGASGYWAILIIPWYVFWLNAHAPTPEVKGTFALLALLPPILLQISLWQKQHGHSVIR